MPRNSVMPSDSTAYKLALEIENATDRLDLQTRLLTSRKQRWTIAFLVNEHVRERSLEHQNLPSLSKIPEVTLDVAKLETPRLVCHVTAT